MTSRAGPTELSLIVAAQAGDREALSKLLTPMIASVVDQIQAKVSPDDAPDVVQDALLAVIEGLPTLRRPECFRAWVRSIVRREIANYYHRRPPAIFAALHRAPMALDALMAFDRAEDRALIESILATATGRQREALHLRLQEDCTYQEIGEQLHVSAHAAEDLVQRGKRTILSAGIWR